MTDLKYPNHNMFHQFYPYPLVICYTAIEHGHRKTGNLPIRNVDFPQFFLTLTRGYGSLEIIYEMILYHICKDNMSIFIERIL